MALIDPRARQRDRRQFTTMLLTVLAMLLLLQFMTPPAPPATSPTTGPDPESPPEPEAPEPPVAEDPVASSDDLALENDALLAYLTNHGGGLGLVRLKDYRMPGDPTADLSRPENWMAVVRGMEPAGGRGELTPETEVREGAVGRPGGPYDAAARCALALEIPPGSAATVDRNWEVVAEEPGRSVTFQKRGGGALIQKTISLETGEWTDSEYAFRVRVVVTAEGGEPGRRTPLRYALYGSAGSTLDERGGQGAAFRGAQIEYTVEGTVAEQSEHFSVSSVAKKAQGTLSVPLAELHPSTSAILYVAGHSKYFVNAIIPSESTRPVVTGGLLRPLVDRETLATAREEALPGWVGLSAAEQAEKEEELRDDATVEVSPGVEVLVELARGEQHTSEFLFYTGPMRKRDLAEVGLEGTQQSIRLCGFIPLGPFARLLTVALNWMYALVGNYGWAIILLTLVIKIMLAPINRHQQGAMMAHAEKMKKFQPRLKEIEARYKGKTDPRARQKKQEETMEAFREAGIRSPVPPGCLMIFLQMPIFVGLYSALQYSVELRHAPFLWIQDLSAPDHLFQVGGFWVNLLPILMTAVWFLQARLSARDQIAAAASPEQQMSAKMMMYMPVVFGIMFYNGASGLVLYWTLSTGFSIVEQRIYRKWIARAKAAKGEEPPAARPPSSGRRGKGWLARLR